jgi:hypothetical protein
MKAVASAPKGVADKMDFDKILAAWKTDYLTSIENSRAAIENAFQSTLNLGYRNMFIAAGVVALIGLLAALMLSGKKAEKTINK